VSATLLVYGITEMVHGYGFIAVFVAAITIRNYELDHQYHKALHSFSDQIERILLAIVLILFGGGLVSGLLLGADWTIIVFALIAVLVIRPIAAISVLFGKGLRSKEKVAISFYGIKGLGSFYYLSFAIQEADFKNEGQLWTIASVVVLFSIVIHGTTATKAIHYLAPPRNKEND